MTKEEMEIFLGIAKGTGEKMQNGQD